LGTGTVEIDEIIYATVLMAFSCWFMLGVSGKIFRTAILLYGKKITLHEVIKWVRA
jgi:ABC-2 type transport system permease protein